MAIEYLKPDPSRLGICPGGPSTCGRCTFMECLCWCHVMWPRRPYPDPCHPVDCACQTRPRRNGFGRVACLAGRCYVCRQPLPGGKMMDVCGGCRPGYEARMAAAARRHTPPQVKPEKPATPATNPRRSRAKKAKGL